MNVRPADTSVHDVDLDTFHGWFTTAGDLSYTDEDSSSSLQSPIHGMTVPVLLLVLKTLHSWFTTTASDLSYTEGMTVPVLVLVLETFHGWFTTAGDLSYTDEDSSSSLQSPIHGMTVPVLVLCTCTCTYDISWLVYHRW